MHEPIRTPSLHSTEQPATRDHWLGEVARCGSASDATGMLTALVQSGLFDGLKRRMTRGELTGHPAEIDHDVDMALAEATDALYESLSTGRVVHSVAAFLVKVAKRRLADLARTRSQEGCGNLPEDVEARRAPSQDDEHVIDPEQKRREAFRVVRSLLPRLGQTRAQQVMELFVQAAEANVVDLPDAVVAETLGIDVETAKKSRQRAFQRLTRIAEEEGLGTQILDRMKTEASYTEDES